MDPAAPEIRFPSAMTADEARSMLAAAYAEIDEGKLLRRVNKRLRAAGIDPPNDVQYVAEPHVEADRAGLGVHLHPNILIYEEFPELESCVRAFEAALGELLAKRLEKRIRQWQRNRRRQAKT